MQPSGRLRLQRQDCLADAQPKEESVPIPPVSHLPHVPLDGPERLISVPLDQSPSGAVDRRVEKGSHVALSLPLRRERRLLSVGAVSLGGHTNLGTLPHK